jgi:hypothetical protein
MTTEQAKTTGLGGFRQVAVRVNQIRARTSAEKDPDFSLLSPAILPNQNLDRSGSDLTVPWPIRPKTPLNSSVRYVPTPARATIVAGIAQGDRRD